MANNEKKVITLEQAKMWRLILRLAFFLIAFVTPTILIAVQFKLFTQSTVTKWSITGLLLLLIVAWRFKNKITEWINSWEDDNIFKHILIAIGKIWPFILVVCVLGAIKLQANIMIKTVDDILFCLGWTCVCELFSYLILYPLEMKMDYLVKRMIRKKERKEDYKEAIKEMQAEEENNGE